jgi:3',5'-cyclic AMP phosphodiesterase CpdA
MPHIIDNNISRKEFLIKSIKIGGALITWGALRETSFANDTNKRVHLALLADTHVKAYQNEQYRGFFPARNFETVIQQVNTVKPQGMIINGDVARLEGELGDYTAIRKYLSAMDENIPVYMALGNHDNRDNFNNIFGREGAQGLQDIRNKHVLVIEYPEIRCILLDSLMYVNKTPGLLGKSQRMWLEQYLEESDKKMTFLFVHHTLNDGDGDLLDADRLFNILRSHRKVKAIFYGHSHIYSVNERDKLKLINIPAVGYNFIDSQPVGWLEARISRDSGLFKLHAIGGNVEDDGEVTEVKWK